MPDPIALAKAQSVFFDVRQRLRKTQCSQGKCRHEHIEGCRYHRPSDIRHRAAGACTAFENLYGRQSDRSKALYNRQNRRDGHRLTNHCQPPAPCYGQ